MISRFLALSRRLRQLIFEQAGVPDGTVSRKSVHAVTHNGSSGQRRDARRSGLRGECTHTGGNVTTGAELIATVRFSCTDGAWVSSDATIQPRVLTQLDGPELVSALRRLSTDPCVEELVEKVETLTSVYWSASVR